MSVLDNLGISYSGDYITQGGIIDKFKKSASLQIEYAEFMLRNDKKDMDYDNVNDYYPGKIILHAPTLNLTQTNLKIIKDSVTSVITDNLKLVTIDASSLTYEVYDWSTSEEQRNYVKNIARGLAGIVSCDVYLAIENTDLEKGKKVFGYSISNISDLLMYTRNILVEEYEFTKEEAINRVGISLNIGNLINNKEESIEKWFQLFNNDIKCIKVNNIDNTLIEFNEVLDLLNKYSLDIPLLIEIDRELETISDEYNRFRFLVSKKISGMPLNYDGYTSIPDSKYNEYNSFTTAQSGYTNLIVLMIILLTVITAVLMVMVKLGQ